MRRLKLRDDRGGVLILTVLVMVMLMGAVALATDGSALVVAKRSAQNSADAAALALAQDCVRPGGSCPSSPSPYLRSRPEQLGLDRRRLGHGQRRRARRLHVRLHPRPLGRHGHPLGHREVGRPHHLDRPLPTDRRHLRVQRRALRREGDVPHLRRARLPNGSGQFGFIQGGCSRRPSAPARSCPARPATTSTALAAARTTSIALLGTDVLVPVWTPPYSGGYPVTAYAVFHLTG